MNNHAILTDFEIFQGLVALMFNATLKISYITSVTLCLWKKRPQRTTYLHYFIF